MIFFLITAALCLAFPPVLRTVIAIGFILAAAVRQAIAAARPRQPAWVGQVRNLPPPATQIATAKAVGFDTIDWADPDTGASGRLPRLRGPFEELLAPVPVRATASPPGPLAARHGPAKPHAAA